MVLEATSPDDGAMTISDIHAPHGGGMSSVTLLFDANAEHLVARMAPDDTSFPVFPSYDIAQQFEVMRLVAEHSDVPVPPIVGVDATGDVLGAPCRRGLLDDVELSPRRSPRAPWRARPPSG